MSSVFSVVKLFVAILLTILGVSVAFAQAPPIEPGVSQALAQWRAARYSDVRYKLTLTLEKMAPVLKGTIEIRANVAAPKAETRPVGSVPEPEQIILDWRKLPGHEKDSMISNVSVNGKAARRAPDEPFFVDEPNLPTYFAERNEHLIFRDGVVPGENVIKLDFTSPILTSGSAITRYVDKEDGAEYLYSLFVPSDASTAFPVFDQPDLKARFQLHVAAPQDWKVVSNAQPSGFTLNFGEGVRIDGKYESTASSVLDFEEAKPISTYVFAFAAGPFEQFVDPATQTIRTRKAEPGESLLTAKGAHDDTVVELNKGVSPNRVFVRRSQAAKFKPHAAEVFRLTREGVKYLETYFDYKFPWPKYDLVLIPEFPFGGMEHAGATYLRESSVIFPTEPTKGDEISRANLIFHETAHQWFGDTVTMKWFDDLWLKEGFAEFMAYKTLEKVMPEANAWKVFYERNKQAAYATDSTRGTTPIYQPIANLSAAKSAYGNIVYRKAPSFLRQAEFYLGPDKFQTAVRAFLKKHEFANAGWEDLVGEFEGARGKDLKEWATIWVTKRGVPLIRISREHDPDLETTYLTQENVTDKYSSVSSGLSKDDRVWTENFNFLKLLADRNGRSQTRKVLQTELSGKQVLVQQDFSLLSGNPKLAAVLPNYGDYGYGIFLLDDKSRDYVLKHIGEEKDPFLRSMMWGALWDSVREAELDPKEYVELAIRALSPGFSRPAASKKPPEGGTQNAETDETILASILGRVGTAMNYYLPQAQCDALAPRLEDVLLDRLQHSATAGQRITFYRAFVNNASTAKGREVLKEMVSQGGNPSGSEGAQAKTSSTLRTLTTGRVSAPGPTLRTKDKFDIVTRLAILGDADAPKLLAELEKTETGDDAKRYAYAAHAAFATAENKAKFWNDFVNDKEISESWIEAAIGPFNSVRHADLTQQYLERALAELPNLKRTRKIFFVNNWLAAWIGGQRDEAALATVNKFLADNPNLDNDLRLKILENVDLIERAVKIRKKFSH